MALYFQMCLKRVVFRESEPGREIQGRFGSNLDFTKVVTEHAKPRQCCALEGGLVVLPCKGETIQGVPRFGRREQCHRGPDINFEQTKTSFEQI